MINTIFVIDNWLYDKYIMGAKCLSINILQQQNG
nr:MAG TPA: hypothetical protein [Crassvirales sp.]